MFTCSTSTPARNRRTFCPRRVTWASASRPTSRHLLLEVRSIRNRRLSTPHGHAGNGRQADLRQVLQRRNLRPDGTHPLRRQRERPIPHHRRESRCAGQAGRRLCEGPAHAPTRPSSPSFTASTTASCRTIYGDDLYVLTDYQAENYRIVRIKLSDPAPEHWQTIVPEGKDVISTFSIVGGKLFATGLHDVVTETRDLRPGRQAGGQAHVSHAGRGLAGLRPPGVERGLLQLPVVQYSADHLSLQRGHRKDRSLRPAQGALRLRPVRSEAGLLQLEGRHPRAHVHLVEEGREARRQTPRP